MNYRDIKPDNYTYADHIREVTDDFVSAFPTKADCTGGFALCIASGMIPEAVDETDPRVIEIVQWCKDYKLNLPPASVTR